MSAAKAKGTAMETAVARYLALHLDDRIERRARSGSKDRGDLGGVRHMGQRVVVEIKNFVTPRLSGWLTEAELERRHDDAGVAIVVYKRHGKGHPGDQVCMLTLRDLVSLMTGTRPDDA